MVSWLPEPVSPVRLRPKMRWGAVRLTEAAKQIGARSIERHRLPQQPPRRRPEMLSQLRGPRHRSSGPRACRRWRRDCRVRLRHRPTTRVWAAMDGGVGEVVREAIGKTGIVPMREVWDGGFRQIT